MPQIKGNEDLLNPTPTELGNKALDEFLGTNKVNSGYEFDLDPRIGEFQLDSEYDAGIQAGMDQQLYRAENQPGSTQAFNSLVGGIASGVLTAVEDASYLLDFDNHIKAAQGLDTNERNWLAEAMISGKESLKEALPIYRKTNETFDWSDPGFYWESLRGVLDSAVGFGLPGGAIAKGVGATMKATRASAYLRLVTGARQSVPVSEALISGSIQNYAEGKMMALETYEETMKSFEPLIYEGKMTEKDAQRLAGQAADDMLMHNRAMILTDAFSLYGLTKGLDATRNVLKQKGFTNRMKDFGKNIITPNADNLLVQGGKEAGEEIVQNVIQMEAKYQAQKEAGKVDKDIPEGTLERLLYFAKSDQALLEGMMGFFGGGPQRILSEITSGNLSKSAREAYEKRYNEQQSLISAASEFIQGHIKNQSERFKKRDELLAQGKYDEAMLEEKGAMHSEIMKHAAAGTLGEFEAKIQEMITEKGSEIGTEGVQKLNETLTDLKQIEKIWIKNSDMANVQEIAENRSNILLSESVLNHLVNKESQQQSELIKSIERRVANYKDTFKYGEKGLFGLWTKTPDGESAFTFDLNNLTKNPYAGTDQVAAKNQYNKFVGTIRKTPEYQEWIKTRKEIADTQDKIAKFEEDYDYLRTKEAEREYQQNEFERIINRATEQKFREESQEAIVSNINPGNFYKAKDGAIYKVKPHPKDNSRVLLRKWGGKSDVSTKKTDLDNIFLTDQGYIQFTDKETAEAAAKEAEKTADNIRQSQDPVTPKEKIIAKSRINYSDIAEDLEPSNDLQEDDQLSDTEGFFSRNPLSVAWFSVNNSWYKAPDSEEQRKLDEDITAYLENKENDLVGATVEFEILEDNENEDEISIAAYILDEAGNRVTHNGSEIQLFIHKPSFATKERMGEYAETYKEDIRVLRRAILNGLKEGSVTTTIIEKRGGTLQTDNELKTVTEVTGQKAEDVELLFQNKTGTLDKVKNHREKGRTKNLIHSDKLGPAVNNDRAVGAVYATTQMANGEYFPLRLRVDNLTEEEANLVVDIYLAMYTNKVNPKTQLKDGNGKLLLEQIESSSPRVSKLLDVIVKSNLNGIEGFKKENITVGEILDWLVHEGEKKTAKNTFPLYMTKGNIFFGKKGKQVTSAKDIIQNRTELVKYLTEQKIRNINYRALNLPHYKEYLFEADEDGRAILLSNAKISNVSKGPMFAQPTIVLDDIDNSQSHRIDSAASIKKQLEANQKRIDKKAGDGDFYIIDGEKYRRTSSVLPNDFDGDPAKYEDSRIAGKTVDTIIRDYFAGNLKSTYPKINKKAYQTLIARLDQINAEIKARGEVFLTSNIVLFNEDLKIAGEVDILSLDKDGNYNLYDVKTTKDMSKYDSSYKGKMTKRQQHSNQLSAYNNLFEAQYGRSFKKLAIMPFELKYTKEGSITELIPYEGISHSYNPGVEEFVPKPSPDDKKIDTTISNAPAVFDFEEKTPTEKAKDDLGLRIPSGVDLNETQGITSEEIKKNEDTIKQIKIAQGEIEDKENEIYESFGEENMEIAKMAEDRYKPFQVFFFEFMQGQNKSLDQAVEKDLNVAAKQYIDLINKCINA